MNNSKMDYGKKYHYIIKYLFMAIPLFLLLLCYLFPTKSITNIYALEETTTTQEIQYKYQTNNVSSSSDLHQGNIYYFNVGFFNGDFNSEDIYISIFVFSNKMTIDNHQLTFDESIVSSDVGILDYTNELYFNYIDDLLYFNLYNFGYDSDCYISLCYEQLGNVYIDGGVYGVLNYFTYNNYNLNDYITRNPTVIRGLTDEEMALYVPKTIINNITNNTYDSETLTQIDESKKPNLKYIKPLNDFYHLNINGWYDTLLVGLHLNLDDDIVYYLYHIPLYLLYLYMFDLILDVFGAIFRIAHRFIIKFGGDY